MATVGRKERRKAGSLPVKSSSPQSSRSVNRGRQRRKAGKGTFSGALFSLGVLTASMGTVAAAVYATDVGGTDAIPTEDSHLKAQAPVVDVVSSGDSQEHFVDLSLGSATVERPKLKSAVSSPEIIQHSKEFAKKHLQKVGYDSSEFQCLDTLYTRESNWRHTAVNRTSGAYGIPQALPSSKMASVADDWQINPETQIIWGIGYIKDRYGSPCGAAAFWNVNHWY